MKKSKGRRCLPENSGNVSFFIGKGHKRLYSDGIIRKALFNDYDYIIYFETGFFVMYSAKEGQW